MKSNHFNKKGYIIYPISSLQCGDIVVTAENSVTSQVIRLGTNSDFSHAMIMLNEYAYIHAVQGGVQKGNIQRIIFEEKEYVKSFRLKAVDLEKLSKLVKDLEQDISKPYSIKNAINAKFKLPIEFESNERTRYCSQLVALAYNEIDIKLVKDPYCCTPEELIRSQLLEEIPLNLEPLSRIKEEDSFYYKELQCPNLIDEQRDIIFKSLSIIHKKLNCKEVDYPNLYKFLSKNPDADKIITEVFDKNGYFNFYLRYKEVHPYRYTEDFKEFYNGLNPKDRDCHIDELNKMMNTRKKQCKEQIDTLKTYQKECDLNFFKKELESWQSQLTMYLNLQNNIEQYKLTRE